MSRESGSTLGVAVIRTFIARLCRDNVADDIGSQVPGDIVEVARVGLGVVAGIAPELPPDVASAVVAGVNEAFISAMNSGFWVRTAVPAGSVAVVAWPLPSVAREHQVERADAAPIHPWLPFTEPSTPRVVGPAGGRLVSRSAARRNSAR